MEVIAQWAAILSPIIAIIIAVCASRKSAKDTARHIESVEESTRLQVESIKELSQIQIETTLMQIDKELRDDKVRLLQASRRRNEINQITPFEIQMNINNGSHRDYNEEKRNYSDEIDYLEGSIDKLTRIKERLVVLSNQQ